MAGTVRIAALSACGGFALLVSCGGDEFEGAQTGVGDDAGTSFDASFDGSSSGGVSGTGGASTGGARGGAGGASGTGGEATDAEAGLADGPEGSVVEAGPPCVTGPPPEPGLYVNVGSVAEEPNGSLAAPYTTIQAAIDRALETDTRYVYIAPGTYSAVQVKESTAALTISGGWTPSTLGWERDCHASANERTVVIGGATSPAFDISSSSTTRIERLTARSADRAVVTNGVAGSVVAIVASGTEGAALELDTVIVQSGRGSDAEASAAPDPAGNVACEGVNDCSDASDAGMEGDPGDLATPGTFSPEGYEPANGTPGLQGKPGPNGSPGSPGGACTNCFGSCRLSGLTCTSVTGPAVYGTRGKCGCGGLGGEPGAAGRGGGASVGVLLHGGIRATAWTSFVRSGRGGDASAGAGGGAGGPGGEGAPGAPQTCDTTAGTPCVYLAAACLAGNSNQSCTASAGAQGGTGLAGGKGGPGGGGFGGPSYAVVLVGEARWASGPGTELQFGSSGRNGDGVTPSGNAGVIFGR